jgi:GPH family glycoside/pentoside/hexuronide:cation symporter
LRHKLGFGVGDFGFNLYWQSISLFLLFFYTDVMGISPAWAGFAYLIASIWDGVSDPMMGVLADRTRTRWGRYRPYLLFGSVPLAVSLVLAFTNPPLSGLMLVAYATATHVLLRTAYTVLAIPYSSLSARMTRDANARTGMAGYRMQFASAANVTVAFLVPLLVEVLGRGDVNRGYLWAMAVLGALSILVFFVCFLNTFELEDEDASAPGRLTLGGFLRDASKVFPLVARSGPLLRVFLIIIVISVTISMLSKTLLYYFKYDLENMAAVKLVLPVLPLVSILSIPFWVRLIRATSKRTAWLYGSVVAGAGFTALFFNQSQEVWATLLILGTISLGGAVFGVGFWSMLPDTVEYNEWKFGERDEAKVFGFATFAQKVALGISAMLLGWLLGVIGFTPNAEQSQATLTGLRAIMALIPLAGIVIAAVIIWGYPLDARMHRQITDEIRARRQNAAKPAE